MSAAPIRPRATDSGPAHATGHNPVLLHEVVAALAVREGGVYVDGTLGGGGYARAILAAAPCSVWGIDRDPDAIERNRALAAGSGERLHLVQGRFGDMDTLLADAGVARVDGVALDLGVSSPQIDQAERGFSFAKDGPLDMRMERAGTSAADVVNEADERSLTAILRELGEERHARRVARAILAARDEAPIETTGRLAEIVRASLPKPRFGEIDPATRTFQALRIHVNDELGELMRGLVAAEALLRPGGRLAVVSFHSLEDRRVKTFLRRRSGAAGRGSRHLPDAPDRRDPAWRLIDRKPVRPGESEIAGNPRARSARLRVGERTDAPSWGPAAEEDAG